MSLINWLKEQSEYPRFYWSSRDSGLEIAGAGVLSESVTPKVDSFGILRFDERCVSDALWKPFGRTRFIVPKVMQSAQRWIPGQARDDSLMSRSHLSLRPLSRSLESDWVSQVQKALHLIETGYLNKIVLAHRPILELLQSDAAVDLLAKLQVLFPKAYHFLFEPEPDLAFVGASPEQLFRRQGNQIFSEAQAGTRPRGKTPEEDVKLAQELLESLKERCEHEWVVHNLSEVFEEICSGFEVTQKTHLVRLPNVQHLRTYLSGVLKTFVEDKDILAALHPTAAVCGWPRRQAFDLIRELEGFDRGFYAGALGYVGLDESEFAVAIRCAVVQDSKRYVFGGAGIVRASKPEQEWLEIANKTAFWDVL